MRAIRIHLAACSLAALAAPALGSIPGNMEERAREGLLHVCVDKEPLETGYVECDIQVFDASEPLQQPYTGEECTAVGLPAACTIDFIPKVKLSGRLLLVNDDTALDGGSTPSFNGEAAVLVELKKGAKKASFVELFDGIKIGNWNGFAEFVLTDGSGIDFDNDEHTVFQFANDNLTDLGLEIRALAAAWFPNADLSQAVAVLTVLARDPKRPPLAQSALDEPLGSGAWFKIVIRFARVRP
jgi:hypothetical protein